jgi:hypothetical protein
MELELIRVREELNLYKLQLAVAQGGKGQLRLNLLL